MREHFPDIEAAEDYSLATLLDPRFRKSGFSNSNKAESASKVLLEKVTDDIVNESAANTDQNTSVAEEDDEWATCMLGSSANDGLDSEISVRSADKDVAATEINAFFKEKNINRKSSPFVWWAGNHEKYPHLAKLARRYLSAPIGSVASERGFKVAKRVQEGRWRLKTANVEKLLFLKYNLRMCGSKY